MFKTLYSVLNTCHFLKQLLTPEDGQFRPKHVVILKESQAGKETTKNRQTRKTKGRTSMTE
jgi:hypothetical protein